jgi:hypothetical protein
MTDEKSTTAMPTTSTSMTSGCSESASALVKTRTHGRYRLTLKMRKMRTRRTMRMTWLPELSEPSASCGLRAGEKIRVRLSVVIWPEEKSTRDGPSENNESSVGVVGLASQDGADE